jgi:hypothetical protein
MCQCDLHDRCLCGCLRLAHYDNGDGPCTCGCPEFRLATVNCWEESGEYPNTSTCMLVDGHSGPHSFTSDSEIVIGFLPKE